MENFWIFYDVAALFCLIPIFLRRLRVGMALAHEPRHTHIWLCEHIISCNSWEVFVVYEICDILRALLKQILLEFFVEIRSEYSK